jgi:DNA end-binding protein Ku
VEAEELEALRPEPSREIEIEHFVALAEIDPVYFEKSYQLVPADDFAGKPYALLRQAMERSGRVAVGRFVLRTREHLVVIRPTRGILGLETMYFADEVREVEGPALQAAHAAVTEREVDMAGRLIEALSDDWDPARYRDPYRERVLELIRAREPMEMPPDEEKAGSSPPIADLMAALKSSVEAAKQASSGSSGAQSRHRRGGRRAEGR